MCIRDSRLADHAVHQLDDRRLIVEVDLGGELGDLAEVVGAVSYTHLRAHETVLDLVCRLLLEKNNTKRNNA